MTRRYKRHVIRADGKDLNNSASNPHVERYDPNKRLMYRGQLFHQIFPEVFKCIRRTLPYSDIKHIAESPYHCTNMFPEFVEYPEKFGADLSPVHDTSLWLEIDRLTGASIPGAKIWRNGRYSGYNPLKQAICKYLNISDNEFEARLRNIVRIRAELSIEWFADTYPNIYSIEGYPQSGKSPYGSALEAFIEDWGGTMGEIRQPGKISADPIGYHKEKQDLNASRDWGHY